MHSGKFYACYLATTQANDQITRVCSPGCRKLYVRSRSSAYACTSLSTDLLVACELYTEVRNSTRSPIIAHQNVASQRIGPTRYFRFDLAQCTWLRTRLTDAECVSPINSLELYRFASRFTSQFPYRVAICNQSSDYRQTQRMMCAKTHAMLCRGSCLTFISSTSTWNYVNEFAPSGRWLCWFLSQRHWASVNYVVGYQTSSMRTAACRWSQSHRPDETNVQA